MDTPDRKPIDVDARETLVEAARRFMALHPDVQAVALTVVSRTIDPKALSTIIVGADGPIMTPDLWLLSSLRLVDASSFCNDNAKGLILGLDDLASNLARTVEGLRDEQQRAQAAQETPAGPETGTEARGTHGDS